MPPPTALPEEFLLDERDVRLFVATGYLAFAVDDLPREFHEQLYASACAIKDAGGYGNIRQEFGSQLAAESDAILRSARTRGALTSILGPDFAGNAWGGGVLAATSTDQGFHKVRGLLLSPTPPAESPVPAGQHE